MCSYISSIRVVPRAFRPFVGMEGFFYWLEEIRRVMNERAIDGVKG